MNHFNKLPDEILTKIFRYLRDELENEDNFWKLRLSSTTCELVQSPSIGFSWSYDFLTKNSSIKLIRNFREITADQSLRNLCLTNRRFSQVINGRYFTTPDSSQWPILKVDSRYLAQGNHHCLHEKNNSYACQFIKTLANSKFMKYKKLELCLFNPSSDLSCILKAIAHERSNLSSVLELKLHASVISPINLNKILVVLPNIKRLSICDPSFGNKRFERGEISRTLTSKLTRRVLSSLNLNLGFYSEGHLLMDYVLDHLPAREVRMQFHTSGLTDYGWLRGYLLKHKNIIRNFCFTFEGLNHCRLDEPMASLFEGFDYYVEEGNHEYSVISSNKRSLRWKANSASVKYKRLEFFPGTPILGRMLKAIEDDRICLNEVVELNLHRCTIFPEALSRILAALPKIERLNICRKKRNLKMTYHFCRESDPEEQSRLQKATDLVVTVNLSFFDGRLSKQVHEHILANPPGNCTRVLCRQEHGCECMSKDFNLSKDHARQRNSWFPNTSNRTSPRGFYATEYFCS